MWSEWPKNYAVTIVMQMSQNKKLHKVAPMISFLLIESGVSLGLAAIFILGPFA